jgi:UDP-N-acetylglucosamine--dolichyl-phosphate N-acetylglucosaminephosphotransferase
VVRNPGDHDQQPAMTPSTLSRAETLSLVTITGACVAILANAFSGDDKPLIVSLALSGLAFCASFALIRWLGPTFIKAGFKGVDMAKHSRRELPECMGAVCAAVYLFAIIVFIPFAFYKDVVAATSGGGNRDVVLQVEHVQQGRFLHRFPHSKVSHHSVHVPSINEYLGY